MQHSYSGVVGQHSVVQPVVTSQTPSWLTPPQLVQANQQKVWPNTHILPAVPTWMTVPENLPISQAQQPPMQGVFAK